MDAVQRGIAAYLLHHQRQALETIVRHNDDSFTGLHPLPIHIATLADFHPAAAEAIVREPRKARPLVDAAAVLAQTQLINELHRAGAADAAAAPPPIPEEQLTTKEIVPRFHGLPSYLGNNPELSPTVSQLRTRHINRLVTLSGTVVKTGPVQSLAYKAEFECTKCRHCTYVHVDHGAGGRFIMPTACPNRATKNGDCGGSSFRETESKFHTDYQEVKIQERQEAVGIANTPRSFTVLLEHELVDRVRPGEDVEVTGVVLRRWRGNLVPSVKCESESVLQACHVIALQSTQRPSHDLDQDTREAFEEFWRAHEGAPLKGRNKILSGICPQIFGLFHVKLATALSLVGGVAVKAMDGRKLRGEVHLLIVGDPGTGKSQFMRFASRLSPRSVVTSGKGSSNAGLTVTAVKEGNSWSLEAGALVLADGGLCCIDEFSGIKEADRASIHEAMEQQTVSVAKAGLMTTLSTRTAVFAVCNPKGRGFTPGGTLEQNTGIGGPLLSRFDIIVTLRDRRDAAWDDRLASHILQSHMDRARRQKQGASTSAATRAESHAHAGPSPASAGKRGWTLPLLQKYFAWARAKETFTTPESEAVISAYFIACRFASREPSRVTPRLLESATRLSQAHAKLMNRRRVTRQDAVVAVALVELSAAYITGSIFHDLQLEEVFGFVEDPDAAFVEVEEKVLRTLRSTPGTQHLDLGGALMITDGGGGGPRGYGEGVGGEDPREAMEPESEAVRRWRAGYAHAQGDSGAGYDPNIMGGGRGEVFVGHEVRWGQAQAQQNLGAAQGPGPIGWDLEAEEGDDGEPELWGGPDEEEFL